MFQILQHVLVSRKVFALNKMITQAKIKMYPQLIAIRAMDTRVDTMFMNMSLSPFCSSSPFFLSMSSAKESGTLTCSEHLHFTDSQHGEVIDIQENGLVR